MDNLAAGLRWPSLLPPKKRFCFLRFGFARSPCEQDAIFFKGRRVFFFAGYPQFFGGRAKAFQLLKPFKAFKTAGSHELRGFRLP